MPHFPTKSPLLLVSVRAPSEVDDALAGGCDLLDIKEPTRGSLGMADVSAIAAIVQAVRERSSRVSVSVALGEALEWATSSGQQGSSGAAEQRSRGEADALDKCPSSIAPSPPLPPSLAPHPPAPFGRLLLKEAAYVKLGLAGLGAGHDGVEQWQTIRKWFDAQAGGTLPWVAAAYADWPAANAPSPETILEAADASCVGLLIDTFDKQGGNVLELLDVERLAALAEGARRKSLRFAVAGRVQADCLPALRRAAPDIVAVRGAVCRHGKREGTVDRMAVRRFKDALAEAWGLMRSA